jgi:hypothetical protein
MFPFKHVTPHVFLKIQDMRFSSVHFHYRVIWAMHCANMVKITDISKELAFSFKADGAMLTRLYNKYYLQLRI